VPNGQLVSDSVTNWTLSDRRRRVEVDVGVEYGTDAQRALAEAENSVLFPQRGLHLRTVSPDAASRIGSTGHELTGRSSGDT
jgi:hypothetical protein